MAKKKAKVFEVVEPSDDEIKKFIPLAKKIVEKNSLVNAFNEDIDELYWYVNQETGDGELVKQGENDKQKFPVCIGPNRWFDSHHLMMAQDIASNWVRYEIARIIVRWLPTFKRFKLIGEEEVEEEG